MCALGCAVALPEDIVTSTSPTCGSRAPRPTRRRPWPPRTIGKLAGPGKAELAGDDATKAKDRVYGLLHYDTPDGDHEAVFEQFKEELADNGIELATDVEFTLDLAQAQENARTNIAKLMDAGVTTIIYYGDPLTPGLAHRRGDGPELPPGVDPRAQRADGHHDLRPPDRRVAVEERLRHRARSAPGASGRPTVRSRSTSGPTASPRPTQRPT